MTETVKNYLIQAGLAVALVVTAVFATQAVNNKVHSGSFFHMNPPTASAAEETPAAE